MKLASILLFTSASWKSKVSADEATAITAQEEAIAALNRRVETSCAADVEAICRKGRDDEHDVWLMAPSFLMATGVGEATSSSAFGSEGNTRGGDPFLEWMFLPSYYTSYAPEMTIESPAAQSNNPAVPTPPEIHDLNLFFDRMLGSTMEMFSSSALTSGASENENNNAVSSYRMMTKPSSTSLITFSSSSSSSLPSLEIVEYVVDYGVSRLASELGYKDSPEEIPALALQVQAHGDMLLSRQKEEGEEEETATATMRRRMARRLTELDSNAIRGNLQLPFGRDNCCLKGAHRRGLTSKDCQDAVNEMFEVAAAAASKEEEIRERDEKQREQPRELELQQSRVSSVGRDNNNGDEHRRRFNNYLIGHYSTCWVMKLAVLSSVVSAVAFWFWISSLLCGRGADDEEDDDEDSQYYALMEEGEEEEKRDLLRAKNVVYEGVAVQIV